MGVYYFTASDYFAGTSAVLCVTDSTRVISTFFSSFAEDSSLFTIDSLLLIGVRVVEFFGGKTSVFVLSIFDTYVFFLC